MQLWLCSKFECTIHEKGGQKLFTYLKANILNVVIMTRNESSPCNTMFPLLGRSCNVADTDK